MTTPALTVWYDASCPLCATEMCALQRHAGGALRLIDCSMPGFHDVETADAGISREDLLRALHARAADGRWLRGVEVFECVYRLAGIESVARMFAHRRLRPFWDRLYPWIARHRMGLSRLRLDTIYSRAIDRAARTRVAG